MKRALENEKVMVLNKHWRAINVVPLRRAMRLVVAQEKPLKDGYGRIIRASEPKARIVDPRNDFNLYTWEDWSRLKPQDGQEVFGDFRLPRVILLSRHDKIPPTRTQFSRKKIYQRDNYTCQYCGCKPGAKELSIDHVIPKCHGGLTSWTNVVLACTKCNSKKGCKSLSDAHMKLLSKPVKPKPDSFRDNKNVYIPEDWSAFISEIFWEVELVNDN